MSSPRSERGGRQLRRGFTTGACAAAAAKGAALMLRDRMWIREVEVALPAGISHRFELHGQFRGEQSAHCFVVKDAGDDPDVTHGVEVHAEVSLSPDTGGGEGKIVLEGGQGVGRVTKPGLAVPPGEWAINPVPRRMIEEAISEVFAGHRFPVALRCRLSIPDGEERAKRTLNERLGIVGGLSILGTTGVVEPISHRAWTDTLEVALDVALAAGGDAVVLSTGRTSEKAAQGFFRDPELGTVDHFPEEAFVMMGDHVAYALKACHRKGVSEIVLAVQFAKLAKIACGHPQTHVRSSRLDLSRLADWAIAIGLDGETAEKIECANTAREVWEALGPGSPLIGEVAARAVAHLAGWAPGTKIAILLVDYQGEVAARFGRHPELQSKDEGP